MRLESITKVYHNMHKDVVALNNINLNIEDKGLTFIIGSSGCGKTTLLNVISGKDTQYSGKLTCDGKVEVIEQDIFLMESLSVLDNLLLVNDNVSLVMEWLDQFEMKEFSNQKVKKLSIGQKKRVQIIRSLLVDYDYLVCDEPTASLDHENAQLVMRILDKIAKEKCVIIVTHEVALVDSYADRVIKLHKGEIVHDEFVCSKPKYIPVSRQTMTSHKKQNIRLIFKTILAHPMETVMKLCLVALILTMSFVSTSLFVASKDAVAQRNIWRNSENIMITQPNEGNDKYRGSDNRVKEDGSYFYYDLYDKKSIQLVRDNVEGVIGYRYGWSLPNYSLTYGSIAPEMTISDIQKAIEEEDRRHNETKEDYWKDYESWKKTLAEFEQRFPDGNYPDDIVLTNDFRNYAGFKDGSGLNSPDYYNFTLGAYLTEVIPYQLFDSYEMPLKLGNYPKEECEVILAYDLANTLMKAYELKDMEKLIGMEFSMTATGKSIANIKVSGISYTENTNEAQLFFKEGALDSFIETSYEMNPSRLKYVYVYFLSDPSKEAGQVASEINQVIDGEESVFLPYNESYLTESKEYLNPFYFYVYSAIAWIAFLLIEIAFIQINKKRFLKEERIMRTYGYSPLMHVMGCLAVLMLILGVLELCMLPYICTSLNQFVNMLGFASFVEYDIMYYIVSLCAAFLILAGIEGGLYAARTKKHS